MEGMVQVVGDPGQEAGVLQEGEQGKENSHGRKHDGDNPGQDTVYAGYGQILEPDRGVEADKKCGQGCFQGGEQAGKELGGVVGPCNGQPEYEGQ